MGGMKMSREAVDYLPATKTTYHQHTTQFQYLQYHVFPNALFIWFSPPRPQPRSCIRFTAETHKRKREEA